MLKQAISFTGRDYDNLLASKSEMALIDKLTIKNGISSLELMQKAADAVILAIEPYLTDKKICILCGSGNNGGDGLAIAKILKTKGLKVFCIISSAKNYSL
ncbi:MAG: hypothetical protein KDD56_06445, partial [Bdellovibrionales bacterium]|nr:hypothetical protein [Bdellovibrionales bacterium]